MGIKYTMKSTLYGKFEQGRGHSKRAERFASMERGDGYKTPYIHARKTVVSYVKEAEKYGDWLRDHGEGHANMERARELAPQYIREVRECGRYSANSQNLTRSALAKVFDCPARELGEVDRRDGRNITRGRGPERHFGPRREADKEICRAYGPRREETAQLTPRACRWGEDGHIAYVHIEGGKGGKDRDAFVLPGAGRDLLEARCRDAADPDTRLLGSLSGVNVHGCRADYAHDAYDYAMEHGMGTGQLYDPQKLMGVWDKGGLDAVSGWLGHGSGRYYTVAYNYLSYGQ